MSTALLNTEPSNEQEVDAEFLAHMDNTVNDIVSRTTWAKLEAVKISEETLERVVQAEGLENDENTRLFTKFLSLATNFSSASLTDHLNSVPKVVHSIMDLLDAMRREVEEYAEIANQFQELISIFGKLVVDTQHQMGLILPHLSEAKDHLSILSDVFESSSTNLTEEDQNDIKIAMNGLTKGMKQMIDISHKSGQESRQLNDRITKLKTNVHKQRATVHGRIHLSKALSCLSPFAGAGIVARTVGALITIKEFGGPGVLVVGGASLNPIVAIICGAILGGTLIITIAALVYRFWTRHQFRALEFLEKICSGLIELANANMFFLDYLNKSEETANAISTQLEQIQSSMTSIRYRKQNAKVCKKAFDAVEQATQVIESIRNIDVSRWLSPSDAQNFVLGSLVLRIEAPK